MPFTFSRIICNLSALLSILFEATTKIKSVIIQHYKAGLSANADVGNSTNAMVITMINVLHKKYVVPLDGFFSLENQYNFSGKKTSNQGGELESILHASSPKMENFVRKRMFNSQDTEDVIQQTYLEAWACRKSYSCLSSPETWICGIALNLIRKHYQKICLPQLLNIDDVIFNEIDSFCLSSMNPDLRAEHEQIFMDVLVHVQKLPDDMRETIEARLDSDGTYQDMAQRLGVPVGTVRSRLSRIRTHLREVAML